MSKLDKFLHSGEYLHGLQLFTVTVVLNVLSGNIWLSACLAFLAGVIKEIRDMHIYKQTTLDRTDMICNTIGIVLGTAFMWGVSLC